MKKSKKWMSLILGLTLTMGLAACGGGTETGSTGTTEPNKDSGKAPAEEQTAKVDEIYFLNFKPEIAQVYDKIAKDYEAETGIKVKVVTAAAGTYETTLKSEVAKSDPPTIFQINGPVGYNNWKDYASDLKDTKLYSFLSDPSLAVTSGEGVYGIPYVVEGYGIIYNDAIMKKYFEMADKAVSISSAAEINSFDTLKAVVEDMTAKKDALGIKGVFASTSMAPGEQWRWQTHLANLPLYYEFKDMDGYDSTVLAGLDAKEIEFKYGSNYKNIFDLYINNSVSKGTMVGSKSVADSMAEFALGQAAMVQNGNWAWSQINEVGGNTVKAEDIKFMPIYTGVEGEENQGLAVGTENYFAINSKVSQEKQEASIAFLEWLFSSDKGKQYIVNELGFIAPFNTFGDDEKPADPLAKEVTRWMDEGTTSVAWTFAAFPSEEFKNQFGDALLQYAQGSATWEQVASTVTESWKAEKARTSQ
ncbi:carbohydrate ABC transporter substrate-binding protein [Paenibacillus sp. F411]|uniref:Extracellular solute-binding protein family 1 n=1 Tax=Paenibacillus algicola TaxID=2565926 RepID=A0A4P8XPI9_9BACL|nr:ABC transporter substrate-binding protein [Paenibacillus algicola]MBO2944594.1 carbohydrate ABC transporter substrate-binding protein [Paenibacillus sp. F411]QCT04776.1 extracellular solute-binding protein family 1 [Paenibacillus algicola]